MGYCLEGNFNIRILASPHIQGGGHKKVKLSKAKNNLLSNTKKCPKSKNSQYKINCISHNTCYIFKYLGPYALKA